MIYILLIIIAVGVLLISNTGKKLLRILGWIIAIAGIIFLGFLIITGGVSLISDNWKVIINFISSIPVLIGLVIIWVLAFIIAPNYINKLFKNESSKKTFWGIFFICILILIIYSIYMNYYNASHIRF